MFAVAMSKFEGKGLPKEQIEQIHVPPPSLGLELLVIETWDGLDVFDMGGKLRLRETLLGKV